MITCWAAKGGVGTTAVAAALAVLASDRDPTLFVDLAGDAALALGIAAPDGQAATHVPQVAAHRRVDVRLAYQRDAVVQRQGGLQGDDQIAGSLVPGLGSAFGGSKHDRLGAALQRGGQLSGVAVTV